jgi:chorismate mutase
MSERVRALRGAITVDENESEAILDATGELVGALLERNALTPDDVVSCIFTCTGDLDADFPAVAARRVGLGSVPLLCGREIDVPGAMPRVIRILMHCYPPDGRAAQHVYLRGAAALRTDLEAAQ